MHGEVGRTRNGELPAPVARLVAPAGRAERLLHVHTLPPRAGITRPWPQWAAPEVVAAFGRAGVVLPWAHQVEAAEAAHAGEHVQRKVGKRA